MPSQSDLDKKNQWIGKTKARLHSALIQARKIIVKSWKTPDRKKEIDAINQLINTIDTTAGSPELLDFSVQYAKEKYLEFQADYRLVDEKAEKLFKVIIALLTAVIATFKLLELEFAGIWGPVVGFLGLCCLMISSMLVLLVQVPRLYQTTAPVDVFLKNPDMDWRKKQGVIALNYQRAALSIWAPLTQKSMLYRLATLFVAAGSAAMLASLLFT